jgi:hypothetical protein
MFICLSSPALVCSGAGQHFSQPGHTERCIMLRGPEHLLSAFEILRKVTIILVMSVRPFVHPSVRIEQLGSHCTDFLKIWYLGIFQKSVENILVSLKSGKNCGYFTWRPMCILIYRSVLLQMRNVSYIFMEKIKTRFMSSNFFSPEKTWFLWGDVKKIF